MKIKHPDKLMFVAGILAVTILFLGLFFNTDSSQPMRAELAKYYNLTQARMNSPAVEVYVNSTQALVSYANQLHATTIYDTTQGFVTLDTANDVGYILSPPAQNWFGMPFYYGFLLLIPLFVLATIIMKYGD